jgi:hypothetical protein
LAFYANPTQRFNRRFFLSRRRDRITGAVRATGHLPSSGTSFERHCRRSQERRGITQAGDLGFRRRLVHRLPCSPLSKGVPAIAVLDEKGKLLYSQKTGEFEAMRYMQTAAVTDFLVRWKRPAG